MTESMFNITTQAVKIGRWFVQIPDQVGQDLQRYILHSFPGSFSHSFSTPYDSAYSCQIYTGNTPHHQLDQSLYEYIVHILNVVVKEICSKTKAEPIYK